MFGQGVARWYYIELNIIHLMKCIQTARGICLLFNLSLNLKLEVRDGQHYLPPTQCMVDEKIAVGQPLLFSIPSTRVRGAHCPSLLSMLAR